MPHMKPPQIKVYASIRQPDKSDISKHNPYSIDCAMAVAQKGAHVERAELIPPPSEKSSTRTTLAEKSQIAIAFQSSCLTRIPATVKYFFPWWLTPSQYPVSKRIVCKDGLWLCVCLTRFPRPQHKALGFPWNIAAFGKERIGSYFWWFVTVFDELWTSCYFRWQDADMNICKREFMWMNVLLNSDDCHFSRMVSSHCGTPPESQMPQRPSKTHARKQLTLCKLTILLRLWLPLPSCLSEVSLSSQSLSFSQVWSGLSGSDFSFPIFLSFPLFLSFPFLLSSRSLLSSRALFSSLFLLFVLCFLSLSLSLPLSHYFLSRGDKVSNTDVPIWGRKTKDFQVAEQQR